ncbi:KRAB-A domain-containing protein 2-like [Palaemon carinicauda]|uniref:KRAB-A domain-containing protein 2-like n=1 Tax=Palaemon carinicauda TaxID=392227 RepID=UPI0035B5FBFB
MTISIVAIHRTIGHGGRTSMYKATKEKYANIPRDQITLFLQYCEECQLKKSSVRKCMVLKPIVSNNRNSRAQVDLIDMQSQPDGKYRFIFNYQGHLTKMICLRALQTKTADEVSFHLVDIFCDKRDPHILQSDNGVSSQPLQGTLPWFLFHLLTVDERSLRMQRQL